MSDNNRNEIRKEQAVDELAYFEALKNAKPVDVEFGKKVSVVMSVRMPDTLIDNAADAAEYLGISLNRFIRVAIEGKVASLGMLSRLGLASHIKELTDQLTRMSYVNSKSGFQDKLAEEEQVTPKPSWSLEENPKVHLIVTSA